MTDYTLYLKQHVRKAFVKRGVSYAAACVWLRKEPFGLVKDSSGNEYNNEEELLNATSFRPEPEFGFDLSTASGVTLPEGTDRELSGPDSDTTE